MLKKILVANRGEIALRIIRAAKELGIQTLAVYSKVDKDSLHVRFADESVCIGEAPSRKSYLFYQNILGAAGACNADAIHPGYGFLSENADFAAACKALGITFIGPSDDAIRKMGDKSLARKLMIKAGVPVVPGTKNSITNLEEALTSASEIGYPLMIKASAGGGGKGMRIVNSQKELDSKFTQAQHESEKAFGSDELYFEKYLPHSRHIEVQIIGDTHGNIVHLFERECTLQRQHQKLIEESPCPILTEEQRSYICKTAVKAAKKVGYYSAGTVEFLYDIDSKQFYFMEMNTRIQVEHPVTEMISSIDLVKKQIEVAAGEKLGLSQKDIVHTGHAIECRINAEDWEHNFRASPGQITEYIPPGGLGIRVDSACCSGSYIFPYYDSLIAKLISWGNDRDEAILRMRRALDEFIISGIHTTIGFHKKILTHKNFISSDITTNFIDNLTI
ncbi:MAG: acetyl-CoA carboxylase biotin carboxylase subunit [Candidatus Celaenobacter polaris]|nr:acetyl-CoA carboxylase biotin carboxylase subunit [Candidatus Celaenobacter polaris]